MSRLGQYWSGYTHVVVLPVTHTTHRPLRIRFVDVQICSVPTLSNMYTLSNMHTLIFIL